VVPKTSQDLDNDTEFRAYPRTDVNRDPDQAKSQDKDGILRQTAIIIIIIIVIRESEISKRRQIPIGL